MGMEMMASSAVLSTRGCMVTFQLGLLTLAATRLRSYAQADRMGSGRGVGWEADRVHM